jgi:hypothetical protein
LNTALLTMWKGFGYMATADTGVITMGIIIKLRPSRLAFQGGLPSLGSSLGGLRPRSAQAHTLHPAPCSVPKE